MKLKNYEMDNLIQGLSILLNENVNLSGFLYFAINKNIRLMSNEIKEYLDTKNTLIKKYGQQDKNGEWFLNTKNLSDKEKDKVLSEFDKISNIEVDLSIIKIGADDIKDLSLPTKLFSFLDFMIDYN